MIKNKTWAHYSYSGKKTKCITYLSAICQIKTRQVPKYLNDFGCIYRKPNVKAAGLCYPGKQRHWLRVGMQHRFQCSVKMANSSRSSTCDIMSVVKFEKMMPVPVHHLSLFLQCLLISLGAIGALMWLPFMFLPSGAMKVHCCRLETFILLLDGHTGTLTGVGGLDELEISTEHKFADSETIYSPRIWKRQLLLCKVTINSW